jgi:Zn-finger nucleic acid-binding protein
MHLLKNSEVPEMNCPRCNIAMKNKNIKDIKIHECPKCKGIWFDQDELRKAKDQTDPDLNWMDFEIWKHEDRFNLSAKPIPCPKCSIEMAAIQYGDTNVEIDYCSKCRGTWLDEGEFGKIINVLTDELETKSVSDYIKSSLEEAKEIITGPEGLVSEWKDFATVLRMFEYRFFVENPKLLKAVRAIQEVSPFR